MKALYHDLYLVRNGRAGYERKAHRDMGNYIMSVALDKSGEY